MKTKLLKVLTGVILFLMPIVTFAQAPTLGTAANFVLFTTNGAMTNSGIPHLTHLTGNVGSNLAGSISGFGNVDGQMHAFDVASGACVPDVLSLYSQLNGATPTVTLGTTLGNGTVLIPGVYKMLAATTLNADLILDAGGNPGAVFIFQIQGPLSTNSLSKVKLINGALACNVFWKVEGLVSMATGTTMRGTIVANNAAINMSALDTLEGRALSINGAVTVSQLLAYTPIGCGSPVLTGPAAPALVSTAAYGVFSSIGAVTSTPITYVIGDVGSNSTTTTGFNPLNVTGTIHTPPDASTAACAGDLTNVYNYLNGLPIDIDLLDPPNFGFDLVLTPHTYLLGAATMLNNSVYLNAEGNANAVFVIHVNGAFTTTTFSYIRLINGTQAKNVYWLINGAVHIYDNSVFNGTIVAAGAITLNTGDTLNGRALTINGAIAINGSYVNSNPTTSCIAPSISGAKHVCPGGTTTLTDSTSGGTWHSSNTAIATIGSTSGMVTGIAPGTSTIQYTTSAGCISITTMTVNSSPSAITGPNSVCAGNSITLSDSPAGGTWSSSNTLLATAGTNSGVVTGVGAGTPTITYSLGAGCTATKTITVNPLPAAGSITGSSSVCVGAAISLTDGATGGTWSSSNSHVNVSGSGVVTGVSAGISTVTYTVTNSCGTVFATKNIVITTTATAGTISGPSAVCIGSNITLSSSESGGTWVSSNPSTASITLSTGVVTGAALGTVTISYTITSSCGTATTTKTITVNTLPDAGSITGASSVCVGASITLTDVTTGGVWSSSNTTATVSGGVVTGVTAGVDTIRYAVTYACGTATATKIVSVNLLPNAGSITGSASVCVGSAITLTDGATGGTWSSSNSNATVSGSGVVTGVTAGSSIITYTVTNSCGTAFVTKNIAITTTAIAGTISGPSAVCIGSNITLASSEFGGTWVSSNPSTASVTPSTGVVTGAALGTVTISYTITSSCGTATVTKTITVNPTPNAGSITGASSVCAGSAITLTDGVTGGTWSSSNISATVSGGVVTGVTAGADTIIYTVTSACGTATATKFISVNPLPDAGSIIGSSGVCVGATIVLSDAVTGGSWSSSNGNVTVSGSGVVTGVTTGSSTITYTVTNSCGTAFATKNILITTTAIAGTISGPSAVCIGSSITLAGSEFGGTWVSSNPSTASINFITGVVTGSALGSVIINYTITSSCGTATVTKTITVNPTPNAGSITGASSVCVGLSITLTDAVTGGSWSSSNTTATVSGGLVTGVMAGTNTIIYSVTNLCGTATATKNITVNPLPNAGSITGASSVCVGSFITLTEDIADGAWSSSNGNAYISGGDVLGVTGGIDTIIYTVNTACGIATATKTILVNPLPDAGSIAGATSVCVGSGITLTDVVPGGAWSSSNATANVSGGIVTGVTAGLDTIGYAVSNVCGIEIATKTILVNPLPDAGSITGASSVCVGSTLTLTDVATGGVWSSSNAVATVTAGIVTGVTAGIGTISYTATNICGAISATKTITVNPLPDAGNITGASGLCAGSSITLANVVTGGAWSSSNANATVSGGVVTGVTVGTVVINYTVTNVCGTVKATKTITVSQAPPVPVITTSVPAAVCSGTLYQNFGTATPPSNGIVYSWSAVNATVWATSSNGHNALINFPYPGNVQVILSAKIAGISCESKATFTGNVGASVSQIPGVFYFQYHFVCLPNNLDSYQWGYDDAVTLYPTVLTGEINQDYLNTNPDFTHKYYWVNTGNSGCNQKTYFNRPTAIQEINTEAVTINLYPNPANEAINVSINTAIGGNIQIDIVNITGQKISSVQAADNKARIDVAGFPAGLYLVSCYRDGVKVATSRFVKN